MTTYAFFSVPAYGHVNPTLAIVQELVARGEQVHYYLSEEFRSTLEANGATFHGLDLPELKAPLTDMASDTSMNTTMSFMESWSNSFPRCSRTSCRAFALSTSTALSTML